MENAIMSICYLLIVFSIYQLQKQIKILLCLMDDIFKHIKESKDNKSLEPTEDVDSFSERP